MDVDNSDLVDPETDLPYVDYEPVLCAQWAEFLDFAKLGWWGGGVTAAEACLVLADRPNGSVVLRESGPSTSKGSLFSGSVKTAKHVVDFDVAVYHSLYVTVMTYDESGRAKIGCVGRDLVQVISHLLKYDIKDTLAKDDVRDGLVASPYEGRLVERPTTADAASAVDDLARELKVLVERLKSNGLWWGLLPSVPSRSLDINRANLRRYLEKMNRAAGADHGIATVLDFEIACSNHLTTCLFQVIMATRMLEVHLDLKSKAFLVKTGRRRRKFDAADTVLEHLRSEKIVLAPYDRECAAEVTEDRCDCNNACEMVEDGDWLCCPKVASNGRRRQLVSPHE